VFGHASVVEPLLEAAAPDVVVEIGVFRGAMTALALRVTAPQRATVHAIDPEPQADFDAGGLREQHGERFVFHRALSLDVLSEIRGVDAVILDGDHNWYTVYNELTTLARVATEDGRPFPVTLMHDVDWPYDYRDMYYLPDTVPEEYRQPYRQAGMRMDSDELDPDGGLNAVNNNAVMAGGARNGVRRAIEDFMEETDAPLSMETVVGFFGLGVLYDERQLESRPALREAIAALDSPEFLRAQCRRIEKGRLGLLTRLQTQAARRRARAAAEG
jgi:hypothetical protein